MQCRVLSSKSDIREMAYVQLFPVFGTPPGEEKNLPFHFCNRYERVTKISEARSHFVLKLIFVELAVRPTF